ncbi:hypothetical protein CS0771_47410 [Catellatospora sp. IY07-71]|uniref:hypothetical protein n=1 Tax=Catellatospora sp. IY07-71 TaxID=2728827 RepID=UPI001BB40F52|nr:hypothetical protein [Catellatospora sp. IY07-71]BCJ75197.1 hypothetical protein CS0771_47410 [Catellatospora sp. IY07-71]
MDPETLHWASRRYLTARYEALWREYGRLPNDGRQADGYHYTTEAKRIFPRYNVVDAMLMEVERLDPDRLPGVDVVTNMMLAAAASADSPFTEPPYDQVQAEAMADERRLFAAKVQRWRAQPDFRIDPVPYRRVLTPEESPAWRTSLQQRWGMQNGWWHPLLSSSVPHDVLVLTEESMWEDDGVDQVRRVLRELARPRVVELREYGADYLLDVEIFAPRYTGSEGLWTDEHHDWIAYASHEGTVAFGGVLAARLAATWPEADSWRWPGLQALGHR